MRYNKLKTTFTQTTLEFDLDSQKVVRTDGRRSSNQEQTYMDVMRLQRIQTYDKYQIKKRTFTSNLVFWFGARISRTWQQNDID